MSIELDRLKEIEVQARVKSKAVTVEMLNLEFQALTKKRLELEKLVAQKKAAGDKLGVKIFTKRLDDVKAELEKNRTAQWRRINRTWK
jgi:hypothetical protein